MAGVLPERTASEPPLAWRYNRVRSGTPVARRFAVGCRRGNYLSPIPASVRQPHEIRAVRCDSGPCPVFALRPTSRVPVQAAGGRQCPVAW